MVVYVDDILLAGDDVAELDSLKLFLDNQFKIKDLGTIYYFLGLEISSHSQGYLMTQSKYTTDLLDEFKCQYFSHIFTPLDPSVKLHLDMGEPIYDPSSPHVSCTSYFENSISGYYIILGGSTISWKSKKQPTIALSSAEAEYRALRKVAAEIAWLTRLLGDLGLPISNLFPVYCDSQTTLHIAKNPVFHQRTQHIEIDCHYVRECLHVGLIFLHFVSSADQLADIMTKVVYSTALWCETPYASAPSSALAKLRTCGPSPGRPAPHLRLQMSLLRPPHLRPKPRR
uniref:Uncharacterized mitochondrial protein AtMg00810-like n=1 Tax=Nicotiana tabacum TaxID=4097 RepID=A0A1S4DBY5_TOBAC|nr:PREDICTED: uncharacterized mitochondrial protein AtMg00810-like [Nicotiana tabacum]